ncbi:lipase/acyltransferase domain-containing protein [Microcoleus sp. herbarium2]|uniref:lipase/acyltransferase domain-containing protein n=1 Tax=Microcoleus sp. herbarium2 TaxID=3055433 RepID=UPI002FD3F5FE
MISDNFKVTPGDIYKDPADKEANFYQFPYDWRRDNRANAHILKKLIDKRLKRWREASGASDAKVILMAHSMGGLTSRYYLEVLEGWRDSRALFTFGTPYRGSLKAVNFLANGYKQQFPDLTEVVRSLTSIYQLLPIYEVVKVGETYKRIAEADRIPNIDKGKAQDALAFHREIETAVNQHLKLEEYRQSFTVVPIAGVQQPTLQSAILENGKLTVTEDLPGVLQNRFDLSDGDGTVPQVSAIPIERSRNFDNFFIAEKHGALQNQNQVLENLLNCLQLSQFDLALVKAPQAAISLSLDDLYLPDEPVSIQARVTGPISFGKLQAEIASVSHEQLAVTFDFVERERDWLLTIDDLASGLYRVIVQTENMSVQAPSPVHDLFEVAKG